MGLLQLSSCGCGAHQIGLLLIKSGSMSRKAWRHGLDFGAQGLRAHIIQQGSLGHLGQVLVRLIKAAGRVAPR